QPSESGKASAMRVASGATQGRLMFDSSTNTKLTTIQVSQIGNKVSRPVRNRRWMRDASDGVEGVGDDMRRFYRRWSALMPVRGSGIAHQPEADVVVATFGVELATCIVTAPAAPSGDAPVAVVATIASPFRNRVGAAGHRH